MIPYCYIPRTSGSQVQSTQLSDQRTSRAADPLRIEVLAHLAWDPVHGVVWEVFFYYWEQGIRYIPYLYRRYIYIYILIKSYPNITGPTTSSFHGPSLQGTAFFAIMGWFPTISIDPKDFWSFSWAFPFFVMSNLKLCGNFRRPIGRLADNTFLVISQHSFFASGQLSVNAWVNTRLRVEAYARQPVIAMWAPWRERPKCRWQTGSTSPGFKMMENSWDVLMEKLLHLGNLGVGSCAHHFGHLPYDTWVPECLGSHEF